MKAGGPLCEGDIEEADGVLQVFCPWHDYDFDLRTGKSGTSLQVSDEMCPRWVRMLVLSYTEMQVYVEVETESDAHLSIRMCKEEEIIMDIKR